MNEVLVLAPVVAASRRKVSLNHTINTTQSANVACRRGAGYRYLGHKLVMVRRK